MAYNFHRQNTNNLNTPYDYSSIMHYGRTAFSIQYGRDSITPIPNAPQKLQCQSPATIRQTQKMKTSLSLLLLLLGLSQAQPLVEEGSADDVEEDNEDMDISTRILTANNGSSEMLLEGDLVLPTTRNAMMCWSNNCLWRKSSNGHVTIPYTVSRAFSSWDKKKIQNAMQSFHQRTCVRFVPRQNQYDYISFENKEGCYSALGKTGGRQVLSLNKQGCMYHGIIQHEINHALGFQHEQTRSDRDRYVRINWENIEPRMAYNFHRQNTNNLNTPYDYSSIMHYGRTAFSIQHGRESITPIPNARVQIGQRNGIPPEKLQCQSPATIRQTQKMKTSLSLLLLLLGLSQAQPLVEEGSADDVEEDNEDMDISTRILTANNGSSEMLLEGDLVLPTTRNAMMCWSNNCLWRKSSNGHVTIPYTVSRAFSSWDKKKIQNAMQSFHQRTCVRFVPRQNQYDYISFENKEGCYSALGKTGGRQVLSLNKQGCMYHGIIQHEINHALGFQHEQTRSDRDLYVRINWENIEPRMAYNFHRQNTNNLNTPYDYSSIMHYGRTAFSIQHGRESITPIPNARVQIGQRNGIPPEKLHCQSPATIRQTQKMKTSLSLLLLLLGLSQAQPLVEEENVDDVEEDNEDMDISTRILTANNGSSEMLLEGDLVLPTTRNAMMCWSNNCLWRKSSNGHVTIPYTVSRAFSSWDKKKIQNAMQSFHQRTCVRFVPRRNQYDYISFENKEGCYSALGKTGGRQVLSLNKQGCMYHGIIQHEINHALGFQHEQTRSDRDRYVRINWENIEPRMAYNFHRQNTNNLNTPYDYSSIMHYGRTAFSIQYGRDSITPIPNARVQIGQRNGIPPEKLQCQSPATIRQTQKMKTSLSLLLLLLGLSQAQPLVEEGSADDVEEDNEDMDISTRILTANNGSSEMLLEGDLVLPTTRNAMMCWSNNCLWRKSSNGHVTIPYTVSRAFSSWDKKKIQNAMQSFHQRTCVRFVPRQNQYDYISFENKEGCYSALGKTGGRQVLSLNKQGCMYHGIIQHEINHALGFQHEQTRSDRDRYVRINWENIEPRMAYNFHRQNTNNLNTPYDYSSIMHYGRTAFSIQHGRESITPHPKCPRADWPEERHKLHCQSPATIRQTQKMKTSLSLLLLLLGLSQAQPLVEEENVDDVEEDNEDMDISTRILTTNNGSSEMLLEGDLVLPTTRNAMMCWSNNCLWRKSSNGHVTIPYTVSRAFSSWDKKKIQNAMQSFHQRTCVRFVPRRNQYDYISFENKEGCYSALGKTGGRQVLSLNKQGCMYHGIIQHEINHALGFQHEQTRSDRDRYVRINWENIEPRMAYNFHRQKTNNLNTPYDYSSIMHYGRTAFSIQYGRDSITPIPNARVQIGQRNGIPPEKLHCQSPATIRQTQKMKTSLSLLLLLLGLSQAQPLVEEENVDDVEEDNKDMDISTRILTANNGSSEMLLEGDLVLPTTRNAMMCWSNNCLWRKSSNGLVTIPYTVSRAFSSWDKEKIQNAMQSFHQRTCVRFVPRQNQYDYISFENKEGCYSALGKTGGRQVLSLNKQGCMYHGIIQHEINHALGFQHEQTRSDRDRYVRINWENIEPRMAYNFHRQNTNNLNTPYDYSSIMHYGRTAFSIQYGRDSITPIPNARVQIGQRNGMSRTDIGRINRLYGC
ncbi:High choriolytic enzyme 1 [Merluccius polli]|uniref:Metalloendopeptidase n=1 Tax=Merluccius polli TaxID=89951 RepID=A0AA47NAH3_MERPO|nr:High choriolytic enzyme 1 [Merluccius polli]